MTQVEKLKEAIAIGIIFSDGIDPRRLYPATNEQRVLASIFLEQLEDQLIGIGGAHAEMVSILDRVMAA